MIHKNINERESDREPSGKGSLFFGLLLSFLCFPVALFANPANAFPGAQGWAAATPGGRGGKVIRVTTLEARGPGSFAAAVGTKGPRIVVFEVGGVIDLDKKSITVKEPFLTVAGQTAPSPGITFIRVIGTDDNKCRRVDAPPLWPDAFEAIPAVDVRAHVLRNAGARPWDRDAIDRRIIEEVRSGTGKIIDTEAEVGGYPANQETRARFDPLEWDLATMERKRD